MNKEQLINRILEENTLAESKGLLPVIPEIFHFRVKKTVSSEPGMFVLCYLEIEDPCNEEIDYRIPFNALMTKLSSQYGEMRTRIEFTITCFEQIFQDYNCFQATNKLEVQILGHSLLFYCKLYNPREHFCCQTISVIPLFVMIQACIASCFQLFSMGIYLHGAISIGLGSELTYGFYGAGMGDVVELASQTPFPFIRFDPKIQTFISRYKLKWHQNEDLFHSSIQNSICELYVPSSSSSGLQEVYKIVDFLGQEAFSDITRYLKPDSGNQDKMDQKDLFIKLKKHLQEKSVRSFDLKLFEDYVSKCEEIWKL